jgi:hypothetical protein
MRISADDVICGVAAPAVRELMRRYGSAHPAESACRVLGVCQEAAQAQLALLEAAGYLTRENKGSTESGTSWLATSQGNALAQASVGKPGRRATAERRLEQVLARARAYNADPGRLLTIAGIMVVGSYRDPPEWGGGGLELAVYVMRRECDRDQYVRKVLAYARASGRRFGAFHELIYWPDRELRMALKNRSPDIRITDNDTSSHADRLELVYAVSEDLGAVAPAPNVKCRRLASARSPVSPA